MGVLDKFLDIMKLSDDDYEDDFDDYEDEDDDYEWIDINTYRVGKPRTVREGGSSYITGRKAIAEAKKAEEEARKAAKAAQKRNVKKGKGKKK